MRSAILAGLAAVMLLAGCAPHTDEAIPATVAARLPAPVSNNAVAVVEHADGATLYSFNGLGPGKTWEDVTSIAYACDIPQGACREIGGPPVREGRLASVAVALGKEIYLFGGLQRRRRRDGSLDPGRLRLRLREGNLCAARRHAGSGRRFPRLRLRRPLHLSCLRMA